MFPNYYRKFYCHTTSYSFANLVKGCYFPTVKNPGTGTLFNLNRFFVTVRDDVPTLKKDVLTKDKSINSSSEKKAENAEGDGLGISNTGFKHIPISEATLKKLVKKRKSKNFESTKPKKKKKEKVSEGNGETSKTKTKKNKKDKKKREKHKKHSKSDKKRKKSNKNLNLLIL